MYWVKKSYSLNAQKKSVCAKFQALGVPSLAELLKFY